MRDFRTRLFGHVVAAVLLSAAAGRVLAGEMDPVAKKAFDEAFASSREPGRLRDCIVSYQKAVAAAPDSRDVWLEYTGALRRADRLQRAAKAGWRTLELKEDAAGWSNMGNIFSTAGAFDAAGNAYRRAHELGDPAAKTNSDLTNMAFEEIRRGRLQEALKVLDGVVASDPKNVKATLDRGLVLQQLGRKDEALAAVKAGIAAASKDDPLGLWGTMLEKSIEAGDPPRQSFEGPASQPLPGRFLQRPAAGSAESLAVDPGAWHSAPFSSGGHLLAIRAPETWVLEVGPPAKRPKSTPDLSFRPDSGMEFMLTVTGLAVAMDDGTVKERVQGMASDVASNAVEKDLPLAPIKAEHGSGYWFVATDKSYDWKNPKPDDLPYLVQGGLAIDKQMVVFTLLSISKDPAFIGKCLEPLTGCRIYSLADLAPKPNS